MARSGSRVGLFGGTFDPIHFGHLRAAEEVAEVLSLEKVIFVLSAFPPHKRGEELLPAGDRWEMLRRALKGNPLFEPSDVEIRRGGKSYTVETLSYYRERFKEEEIFFILGADAFLEMHTWKEYKRFPLFCSLAVISRPGFEPQGAKVTEEMGFKKGKEGEYLHPSGGRLLFLSTTPIGISSTEIRKRVREGRSIRYLLPPEVERYIRDRELYKKEIEHHP